MNQERWIGDIGMRTMMVKRERERERVEVERSEGKGLF